MQLGHSRLRQLLPGLALVALLTAISYQLARIPGLSLLGSLVIALAVGLVWRWLAGLPARMIPGASFSARTLLRVGIVLLGVRLDFGLLLEVGPTMLLGSLVVVTLGLFGIERMGRWAGLPRGLRLGLAVGTSICGASAILAAVPTVGMKDDEAAVSVGIISVLGTLGVIGFALISLLFAPSELAYGLVVGLTLQEVAQVLAAGYVPGSVAGDLATIVKLTRVALLAPALLVLGVLLRNSRERVAAISTSSRGRSKEPALAPPADAAGDGTMKASPRPRTAPVPLFLVGFLAVGAVTSLGWIGPDIARLLQTLSVVFTAAAMVGLGLGLRFEEFRQAGSKALLVGAAGFGGLLVLTIPFALLTLR